MKHTTILGMTVFGLGMMVLIIAAFSSLGGCASQIETREVQVVKIDTVYTGKTDTVRTPCHIREITVGIIDLDILFAQAPVVKRMKSKLDSSKIGRQYKESDPAGRNRLQPLLDSKAADIASAARDTIRARLWVAWKSQYEIVLDVQGAPFLCTNQAEFLRKYFLHGDAVQPKTMDLTETAIKLLQ